MTKIAYLRATQQPAPFLAPSLPTPVMPFPGGNVMGRVAAFRPKPSIMTPTTRFNSNPTVICDQSLGGRISKPLMEKRRRARINQCLSQLKQIVVDSAGEYTQSNKCKLEKADILELTVNYVKKLHSQLVDGSGATKSLETYASGYAECAKQVCSLLEDMPSLLDSTKHSLTLHLSQSVAQLKSSSSLPSSHFSTPPSPAPSSTCSDSPKQTLASPLESKNSPETSCQSAGESDECYFEFDAEDEEEEEEGEEEQEEVKTTTLLHYKKLMLPLNLKINKDEEDDMWRPW